MPSTRPVLVGLAFVAVVLVIVILALPRRVEVPPERPEPFAVAPAAPGSTPPPPGPSTPPPPAPGTTLPWWPDPNADPGIVAVMGPRVIPHPSPPGWNGERRSAELWERASGLVRAELVDVDCTEFPCLATLRTEGGDETPQGAVAALDCTFFASTGDGSGAHFTVALCDQGIDPAHYPRVEARMLAAADAATRR